MIKKRKKEIKDSHCCVIKKDKDEPDWIVVCKEDSECLYIADIRDYEGWDQCVNFCPVCGYKGKKKT
jgi:hypothetical protein